MRWRERVRKNREVRELDEARVTLARLGVFWEEAIKGCEAFAAMVRAQAREHDVGLTVEAQEPDLGRDT